MPIDRTSHLTVQKADANNQRHSFCRSFCHFLSSNLGLVIVVVAYSIGGAFLFILLEQYIELQNCQQGSLQENVSLSNISETLYNDVALSTDNTALIYEEIVSYLTNFSNDIYDRRNKFRYTGQDCSTTSGWTFPSALLFTISIITSIGFGHITPTSWEGQITCICYALIGIPIFLLCLANISSILGDMFRFMYSTFLHCICCCCRIYARRSRRPIHGKKSLHRKGIECVGTTSVDPFWPDANVPVHGKNFIQTISTSDEDAIDEEIEDDFNDVFSRMEGRVPVLVVISIIMAYVCLGAIMFSNTEDWTMTQSVYFCYITLATVGFGDYVPGITSSSTGGLRFLGACLYIIVGLAILAMCFDLIKESIVDKFAWIAHKVGFVNEDEDQNDDDRTQYANFQYTQPQPFNTNKRSNGQKHVSQSPPAYDHVYDNKQRSKDQVKPSRK